MTRRTRRNHAPAFKAQVALAALKSDKTLAELAQQYDLHPNQITDWKRQLTERAVHVFGDAGSPAGSDPDLTKLHAKIGQMTPENDFLEHALTKAGRLPAQGPRLLLGRCDAPDRCDPLCRRHNLESRNDSGA